MFPASICPCRLQHASKKFGITSIRCLARLFVRRKHQDAKKTFVYSIETPPGEKKCITNEIPSAYQPQYVEAAWYDWWTKKGFFAMSHEECAEKGKDIFTMVIPPPNVTGTLHLGHALTVAISDSIVRWNRMNGKRTLWIPGCDHAGIATQVAVEKQLEKERNVSRHDLGREKFLKEVWKWKEKKGNNIYEELRRLGCSLDWSRACFTMDSKLCAAVTEAFVRLHREGLIYRKTKLVNWSCHLKSAISDIEVDSVPLEGRQLISVPGYEKKVEFGTLTHFAYHVVDSSEEVVVATTRVETMLGDVALAVHPNDERYKHLHGKFVRHPFCDRLLPIVADEHVDLSFGTGAVKVTPAHDLDDYNIGQAHNLDVVTVIGEDGRICGDASQFVGMRRFDARLAVTNALKEKGLFRKVEDNPMTLPVCSRSGDVVEYLLKPQWFLNCQDMARHAVKAVQSGQLEIIPDRFRKLWFDWLDNIQDWCISRQLWWGHRIPAYRVVHPASSNNEIWVSGRSEQDARAEAARQLKTGAESIELVQDGDVLDTWFSSALFPFSVFDWPRRTGDSDLLKYYPLSLMETGHDILFFWVARMVMLGIKLTGTLPFNRVLLHGIVNDTHGRKMSKSLGNVINPMDVVDGITLDSLHQQLLDSNLSPKEIEKAKQGQKKDFPDGIPQCGADALRFSLCDHNIKSHLINIDVTHINSYRLFCNKIWQAFRFMLNAIDTKFFSHRLQDVLHHSSPVDRWILSRLAAMVSTVNGSFASYDLHNATKALQRFWHGELCDVYLECVKPVLRGNDENASLLVRLVLYECIETGLRAISPFMPYISEELYQRLPPRGTNETVESVCIASFPKNDQYVQYENETVEQQMESVERIVRSVRSVRRDYNLKKMKPDIYINVEDEQLQSDLKHFVSTIETLSLSRSVKIQALTDRVPDFCSYVILDQKCHVYVNLEDLIDLDKEKESLEKRLDKLRDRLEKLQRRMAEKNYERRKPEYRQQTEQKAKQLETEMNQVRSAFANLEKIRGLSSS